MTKEQRAEIKARAEKASPGPWEVHDEGRFGLWEDSGPSICRVTGENLCGPMFQLCGPSDIDQCKANTYFLAHARQDIPALLAYVEELEKDVAYLINAYAGYGCGWDGKEEVIATMEKLCKERGVDPEKRDFRNYKPLEPIRRIEY